MGLDQTGQEFRDAALELREANRTMYLTARKEIAKIGSPAVEAVRKSAMETLPKTGHLNEWVADASIKIATMLGARTAGVALRARKAGHDLKSIDGGRVRHPVYGKWQAGVDTQPVTPGFFTRPLEAMEPIATELFLGAMTETSEIAGFK